MSTPPDVDQQMPLIEHLVELRSRLLKAVVVIVVIFLGLYSFSNDIYTFIAQPLMSLLPPGSQMIATEVASPFLAPFKLTLVVALFIAVPFLLYQAWAFIAPGLYTHEKKLAFPLLASSIVLFYSGAVFAYFVVFPLLFKFFTTAAPAGVQVMTDINAYLTFVLKLFFAFGLAFEIPIATFLLILTGAATVKTLSSKRPYIVIGCFVVGMLLTPPDVVSQSLLAVPMWLLFEVGIIFGRFVKHQRGGRAEETPDA
ncbi:twin-arginine translocase subunit TatC [Larsenimonas rhizosphaerae]|uniref:Sec-independent protein translocase protein TatC n=1 Tax=Larsenimonas rhizosphaerae TaxID=2944682 RepID=A0AA42CXW1_9GAMM|nr:twin-arginine translocase subunit TatC [Larsenimonas rhizosphaerae]MCM2129689.1 twin-arginine translocase subunit TatC [Larsenimonas rhizosphaerae]MCX2524348.1 twin-arginine translocase subunit TatC [Larsenimonas rhizosphaerae]